MSENTSKYGMIKFEDERAVKIENCECANVCNCTKIKKSYRLLATGQPVTCMHKTNFILS